MVTVLDQAQMFLKRPLSRPYLISTLSSNTPPMTSSGPLFNTLNLDTTGRRGQTGPYKTKIGTFRIQDPLRSQGPFGPVNQWVDLVWSSSYLPVTCLKSLRPPSPLKSPLPHLRLLVSADSPKTELVDHLPTTVVLTLVPLPNRPCPPIMSETKLGRVKPHRFGFRF